MRSLLWQSDAWKEYESLQDDKKVLKKTNQLLKDIMRNGYECSYGKVGISQAKFLKGKLLRNRFFATHCARPPTSSG